ncbi:MAG: hypothetical protein PHF00_10215, partial [Elusimicrobia bacterium]|nr:hypothetical protein [Elusimicrobiota bacterium]
SPQQPLQAGTDSVLPVAYAARDDSGLSRAALVVRPAGGAPLELEIKRFGSAAQKEFVGDYAWELEAFPAGAKVEFMVKIWDDAVPAQAAVSQANTVEIVDFEAGHRTALRLWSEAESALEAAARREESVRDLYAAGAAQRARGESSALAGDWDRAVAAVESLAKAAGADAYANPGLAEQFSLLAEDLGRARRRDLPAARAAEASGDIPAARSRHGRLADVLRRARRGLEEAKPVQGLQDFFQQAGAVSRDGERIASALQALAQGRPEQRAEALRRVQSALERLRRGLEAMAAAVAALPAPASAGSAQARQAYALPLLAAQTSADALRAALRAGDLDAAAKIADELSRQLAAMEAAVAAAAAGASAAPGGPGSERAQRLRRLWAEVVERQAALAEAGRLLEQRRLDLFLAGQKELLSKLAARQSVLVSSAGARGGVAPQALSAMRAALQEFSSGQVQRAPQFCAEASGLLRAAGLAQLAEAQDAIARELAQAPAAPAPGRPDSDTAQASRRQAEVRGRTADLQRELEAFLDAAAAPASGAVENVAAAQDEQRFAEAELDRGDTEAAWARQRKALDLLDAGGRELERSSAGQQSVQLGIGAGFSGANSGARAAPGGAAGARLEFVPLPSAKDFQPPREIRQELERSLRERRPPAYDGLIKEYFKRLSQ